MKENEIIDIQTKINNQLDQIKKYKKELNDIKLKNETLKKEINIKLEKIQELQKQIGDNLKDKKIDNKYSKIVKESELITIEEQIQKEFLTIQKKINENLKDKYKVESIERLLEQEKKLNISYITIQKLDIKEEFYLKHKIKEGNNLYENLNKLSKIGKLNYYNLKSCGPCITFRLTSESIFEEIKDNSCKIWNISSSTYYLYDDTFNSMELVLSENIQKYFSYFQPNDSTLNDGLAIFYLIEKLKDQKSLLTCQDNIINKTEGNENPNFDFGNDINLFNCINKLKEGKILKGLNKYHYEYKNVNEDFENLIKEPENNILCFFIVLLLFILSLICSHGKTKNIKNWSKMNIMSNNFLVNRQKLILKDYSMYEYLKLLNQFDNVLNEDLKYSSLKFFGMTQYRFFKTKEKNCFDKSEENDLKKIFSEMTKLKCYYNGFNGNNKNKTEIKNNEIKIEYQEKLNITHTYNTFNGYFDKTGFVIRYNPYNKENYTKAYQILEKIINSSKNHIYNNLNDEKNQKPLLEGDIQGIELNFNLYEPNLNIFSAVSILVQKSISGYPIISYFDIIPFLTNIYENQKYIKFFDVFRIVIVLLLMSTILIKINQKIKELRIKKLFIIIIIIINVLFRIKNLILIFTFIFMNISFSINNKYHLNTQKYNDNNEQYYIDFYDYAKKQKIAKYLEQISFLLISLYLFKYSQLFPIVNTIFKCFIKSSFEFFLLLITILCLILGFSITTYYVYGSHIKEYSTYSLSIITNLKLICFIEDTNILIKLNEHFKLFTIIILLFYIIILRFFFLNLFYPTFTEYLRIEREQNKFLHGKSLTFKKKLEQFICGFFNIFGKKKTIFDGTSIDKTQQSSEIQIGDILNKE